MWTPEAIKAMADLYGRQAAERFPLEIAHSERIKEMAAMVERHRAESESLAIKLGVIPTPNPGVSPGLALSSQHPQLPQGIVPGMTAADLTPEMLGTPPEGVQPGQVIALPPIPPPTTPPLPPGAPNIPRPLKDRK